MESPSRVLVLDNDAPRHDLFRAAAWAYELESVYQIPGFEQAVRDPDAPNLICIDHDLGDIFNEDGRLPDTCGCDASDLVVQHVPSAVPVLIHSSNTRCAHVMRRILVESGRRGRVAIVNIANISKHGQSAAAATLRQAMEELLKDPLWPADLAVGDLLGALGDNAHFRCPVRTARN